MAAAGSCMTLTGRGTGGEENRKGVATKIKNLVFYWRFNSNSPLKGEIKIKKIRRLCQNSMTSNQIPITCEGEG